MSLPNRPSSDISSARPDITPDGRLRDSWSLIRTWRLRYVPIRAALVALTAVCLGLWVAGRMLPSVSSEEIYLYIDGHTSGEGSVWVLWMRQCAAQIPLYVLLFCAGLTRFSGALTNGVLLACGMADGATLALLRHLAGNGSVPTALCVAYLARVALELAIRVYMATAACRLARRMDDRGREGGGNRPVFPLLIRYFATLALVLGAVSAICFGYVVLIF